MNNWFADTFSSDAKEEDLVKARSMNTTRITAVVLPILVGISTAIGELADKPPFDDVAFQKRVILAMILLIAAVSVADILGRSIATIGAAKVNLPSATPLPKSIPAEEIIEQAADIPGHVVAFRAANSSKPTEAGEYLFVPTDTTKVPSWKSVAALNFS